MRRLDLEDKTLEGNGVVVTDSTLFFDGENQIKVDVRKNWHKSGAWLFGFDRESFVVFADVNFFEETIGSVFGFNAVQTKFITESALQSAVNSFSSPPCLRRISGNGADAQFCESSSDLSEMAFKDFAPGFRSKEEMACSVRIQGAEDPMFSDTVFEELHAAESAFFLDELHVVDFPGSIVHKDE